MKFEVINISTTTETYIANGFLTHNKDASPTGKTQPFTHSLYITTTDTGYTPANPYTIYLDKSYSGSNPLTNLTFEPSPPLTWNTGDGPILVTMSVSDWGAEAATWVVTASGIDGSSNYPYSAASVSINTVCLTPDTLIDKFDETEVYLEDINVGDELKTINLETMQYEKSIIISKTYHEVDLLFVINETLKSSLSHKHIVKRNDEWIIIISSELKIGDVLIDRNLEEHKIYKIDIIKS